MAAIQADLATLEGVDQLYEAAKRMGHPVEILIANAGRGLGRRFLDQDFAKAKRVVDTNIIGTVYLVQKVGREMRDANKGRILLTVSMRCPTDADATELIQRAGIKVEACIPNSIHSEGMRSRIQLSNGNLSSFDTIYPAMGCTIRSQIASDLGTVCDEVGNLLVDSHQRTGVAGLYAAGDVVDKINQIAVAFGHAAVAATDMHNYLGDVDGRVPDWACLAATAGRHSALA